MTIRRTNPVSLHATAGYSHVTLVDTPAVVVHLAGQMPLTPDGSLMDPAMGPQVDQTVANAIIALGAADVGPADVVRSVVYVATSDSYMLDEVWSRLLDSSLAPALTTASTLLGVTTLGVPGQLVEIDLTAVCDQLRLSPPTDS